MKAILVVVLGLVAGFAGGVLGSRLTRTDERDAKQVISARSFQLVDDTGRVISFWGIDDSQQVVLAFGSRGLALAGNPPGAQPGGLRNSHNHLAVIGLQGDDSPMLKMSGPDRKTRVRMYLNLDAEPLLLMEDETGPRVSLGFEQSDTPGPQDNDWTLVFHPERARLGMFAERKGGQTYVRGGLLVNKEPVKYP